MKVGEHIGILSTLAIIWAPFFAAASGAPLWVVASLLPLPLLTAILAMVRRP